MRVSKKATLIGVFCGNSLIHYFWFGRTLPVALGMETTLHLERQ